jgi:hypothetical protein
MSTATLSGTTFGVDTERVVLFDSLIVVPCDWAEPPCDAPAAWSYRCEGCSEVMLVCQEHRAENDVTVATWTARGLIVVCADCRRPMPVPLPWLPL